MYIDYSIENERQITVLKTTYPGNIGSVIGFTQLTDSEQLCLRVIGASGSSNAGQTTISDPPIPDALSQPMPYISLVQSLKPAIQAATLGDTNGLKALRA